MKLIGFDKKKNSASIEGIYKVLNPELIGTIWYKIDRLVTASTEGNVFPSDCCYQARAWNPSLMPGREIPGSL